MDFPGRLEPILVLSDNNDNNDHQTMKDLQDWNNDIEKFLSIPTDPSIFLQQFSDERLFESSLTNVASNLYQQILLNSSLEVGSEKQAGVAKSIADNDNEAYVDTIIEQYTQQLQPRQPLRSFLLEYIRTGKNMLRWNIQIYSERQALLRRQLTNPVQILQSPKVLELIFTIMKAIIDNVIVSNDDDDENNNGSNNYDNAKNCSLYLFYATYSIFPNDTLTQKGIDYLIRELSFPKYALEILCQIDSIPLALSLVRNLHNIVVSFSGAVQTILSIQVPTANKAVLAPWLSTTNNEQPSSIGFVSVCTSLLKYCISILEQEVANDETQQQQQQQQQVFELMSEILNVFYALRIGQTLKKDGDGSSSLADAVIQMLQLSTASGMAENEDTKKRIGQCKLATVSLLMDSDASFGNYLVDDSASISSLFQILQQQVNDVVDNTKVDNSATAALVPILAVLNKYAMANVEVLQRLHNFVFPPELEDQYQSKINVLPNQMDDTTNNDFSTNNKSLNMSPLDAPKDTLRGKLVVLLSWAESYIKRCTAELLWTLCNSNATAYVHRVGLGNALPLLNAKGLASIPGSS
jgi:hypothetical protein